MRHILAVAVVVLSARVAAFGQAAPADLERVLVNLATMSDLAYYIEREAIVDGKLPRAKTPQELTQALHADARPTYVDDPWGTPYFIDVDPDSGHYMIASAGADRMFQRTTWEEKAETTNPRADTVLRDGDFIRSSLKWALGEVQKLSAGSTSADLIDSEKAARTMAAVRVISTAMELYSIDKDIYPPAPTVDALEHALSPKYIMTMPRSDAWGTPLRISVEKDGRRYRIVSAGADRKFEPSLPVSRESTKDFTRDLLLENGTFVRAWDLSSPHDDVMRAFRRYLNFSSALQDLRTMSPDQRAAFAQKELSRVRERENRDRRRHLFDQARRGGPIVSLRAYQQELASDPTFVDAENLRLYVRALLADWTGRARGTTEAERDEGATIGIELLQKYLAKSADDREAADLLVKLQSKRGYTDDAIATLNRFAGLYPDRAVMLMARSAVQLEGYRISEAIDSAEEAAHVNPKDAKTWYVYGDTVERIVLLSRNLIDPAKMAPILDRGIAALRQSVGLQPTSEAYFDLDALLDERADLETDPTRKKQLKDEAERMLARGEVLAKQTKKPQQ